MPVSGHIPARCSMSPRVAAMPAACVREVAPSFVMIDTPVTTNPKT
jgi:hypothetical protein